MFAIRLGAVLDFAAATGDDNVIHGMGVQQRADTPFREPVVQGALLIANVLAHLPGGLAPDGSRICAVFTSPLRPGDPLSIVQLPGRVEVYSGNRAIAWLRWHAEPACVLELGRPPRPPVDDEPETAIGSQGAIGWSPSLERLSHAFAMTAYPDYTVALGWASFVAGHCLSERPTMCSQLCLLARVPIAPSEKNFVSVLRERKSRERHMISAAAHLVSQGTIVADLRVSTYEFPSIAMTAVAKRIDDETTSLSPLDAGPGLTYRSSPDWRIVANRDLRPEAALISKWSRDLGLPFHVDVGVWEQGRFDFPRETGTGRHTILVVDVSGPKADTGNFGRGRLDDGSCPDAILFLASSIDRPNAERLARDVSTLSGKRHGDGADVEVVEIAPTGGPHPFATTTQIARQLLRLICRQALLHDSPLKAIILDCDDTLWAGSVAEQPSFEISLTPGHVELHDVLMRHRDQGTALCAVSHNAMRPLLEWLSLATCPLKPHDFARIVADLRSRPDQVQEVIDYLGFAEDSILFIDDSWANLQAVRGRFPAVTCLNAHEVIASGPAAALTWLLTERTHTREDALRRGYHASRLSRAALGSSSPFDPDRLLAAGQVVKIRPARENDLTRVSQLMRRATRFTSSTGVLSVDELRALQTRDQSCWVAEVKDKFGDLGIVAALVCERHGTEAAVRSMSLSCRAFDRLVEYTLLSTLVRETVPSSLSFQFRRTERNQCFVAYLESLGLAPSDNQELQRLSLPGDTLKAAAAQTVRPHGVRWQGVREPGRSRAVEPPTASAAPRPSHARARILELLAVDQSAVSSDDAGEAMARRTPDQLRDLIAAEMRTLLRLEKVAPDTDLFEEGGDSLDAVELLCRLGATLQIDVPITAFFETDITPQALANWIATGAELARSGR